MFGDIMGIGNKIKEYRNKANLTQKDLAYKLHVSYQAISKWENDNTEPSIESLKEMAIIFNCSVDELLDVEKKEGKIEIVEPEEKEIKKEVPKDFKKLTVANNKLNLAINVFSKFNWTLISKVDNVNHQNYELVFERPIKNENYKLDLEASLAIQKERINSIRSPKFWIVGVILIAISILFFILNGNINSKQEVYLVTYTTLIICLVLIPGIIILIIGLVSVSKRTNYKSELHGQYYLDMTKYKDRYHIDENIDDDYFIKKLITHHISIREATLYFTN